VNPFELGEGVAETIESVALCLSQCWLAHPYRSKRPQDGILDQEVDKTSLLLINSWAHATQKKIAPFVVIPGRHGPGPALLGTRGRRLFICDVIEIFQKRLPEKYWLFEIVDGEGPWQSFEPTLKQTDWDWWKQAEVRAGHSEDVQFLQDFASIIATLNQRHVIALGRHIDSEKTRRALDSLLSDLHQEFNDFLESCSTDGDSWWQHLNNAYERSRVVGEKAVSDHEDYRSAWLLVLNAPDTEAKKAILECRTGSDGIWGAKEVSSQSKKARGAHHFTTAVWAAMRVWAQEQGVSLRGRRSHDPPQTVAETLQEHISILQQTPDFAGIEVPVDEIRGGRASSCVDVLRRSIGTVMSL